MSPFRIFLAFHSVFLARERGGIGNSSGLISDSESVQLHTTGPAKNTSSISLLNKGIFYLLRPQGRQRSTFLPEHSSFQLDGKSLYSSSTESGRVSTEIVFSVLALLMFNSTEANTLERVHWFRTFHFSFLSDPNLSSANTGKCGQR